MLFIKLHSKEESQLPIKDSFKGFVSNRFRCMGELSSMFVNHKLTIDSFFDIQINWYWQCMHIIIKLGSLFVVE